MKNSGFRLSAMGRHLNKGFGLPRFAQVVFEINKWKGFLMWALLVFGILFLGSAAGHFLKLISDSSVGEGLVCLGISVFCLGAFAILKTEERKRKEFASWFAQNKEAIQGGRASYEGKEINPQTQLVQFTVVISLLVISTRVPSRYYVLGQESTTLVGIIYSVITLITGWWGIPHGPIWTVKAVYKNLTNGYRISVSDLLNAK